MKRIALAIWLALGVAATGSANATQPVLTAAIAIAPEQQQSSAKIAAYVAALEDVEMMRNILKSLDLLRASTSDMQNVSEIKDVICVFADELLALRAGEGDYAPAARRQLIAEHEATLLGLIHAKDEAIAAQRNRMAAREARIAAEADMDRAVTRAVDALDTALGYRATTDFAARMHRILGIAAPDPALLDAFDIKAQDRIAALSSR